jgi:hypothetical protein
LAWDLLYLQASGLNRLRALEKSIPIDNENEFLGKFPKEGKQGSEK